MPGEKQNSIGDAIYKFVGYKVSKVRWCPSQGQVNSTSEFVTGSWDDEINCVSLWNVPNLQGHKYNLDDSDLSSEPELLTRLFTKSSITDIKFLDPSHFVVGFAAGDVSIFELAHDRKSICEQKTWQSVHRFPDGENCPCTSVATNDSYIATAGEDGTVQLLRPEDEDPQIRLDGADGTAITGITFIRPFEVATVNSIGQMKLWDLRDHNHSPTRVISVSGEKSPLSAIDRHPDQFHLLTTGSIDGNVGFWDLRQEKFPVTLVEAHSSSVWEVKFHRLYPDNLFTCSEEGSLWYWDGSVVSNKAQDFRSPISRTKPSGAPGVPELKTVQSSSVWLSFDINKHRIETYSLLPSNKRAVNSFDIESKALISCTDSEALILVKNVPIR